MKILHLNQYGTHVGGAEGYIADVSEALAQEGHSSLLVYFSPTDAAGLIQETRYAPLPEWPAPAHEAIRVIEQAISAFHPDVAYLHAVYHPAVIEWVTHQLPTVAYVHGPYPVCPGSAQYLRRSSRVCPYESGLICLINAQLERCCWGRNPLKHLRLLRRVRAFVEAYAQLRVILVGSRFMRRLLQQGGIPSEKLTILPPILIQEPFPPMAFPTDSRIILFAGRLTPEKGLHCLIEALADVGIDWQLVVAGDGPEQERCQLLAIELGIARRVLYRGWLEATEMAESLESCACVAVPSLWPEPYGRVGPEAFLHGRPAVAFAAGGIPDWLEHGKSGYLVPPGDTAQLGGSLRALLESPDLRRRMSEHAREMAMAAWDAHAHVAQLLSAFEQVRAQGT